MEETDKVTQLSSAELWETFLQRKIRHIVQGGTRICAQTNLGMRGEDLKRFRLSRNKRQMDMAMYLGISPRTLQVYEQDDAVVPFWVEQEVFIYDHVVQRLNAQFDQPRVRDRNGLIVPGQPSGQPDGVEKLDDLLPR